MTHTGCVKKIWGKCKRKKNKKDLWVGGALISFPHTFHYRLCDNWMKKKNVGVNFLSSSLHILDV